MRVMTIVGTRPELIRLSLIISKLDRFADRHILVHTSQNQDPRLRDVFFQELRIRKPDFCLGGQAHTFGAQVGAMFSAVADIIHAESPDCLLVLGDTNSALCALLGARLGIPVYHMEAGNRCYDFQVPEEINRRAIDAVSTFNLPYTPQSRENLLREGMDSKRVFQSGNPIFEVMQFYRQDIAASPVLRKMNLESRRFLLVTAHRAENVDQRDRLASILDALCKLSDDFDVPVVISVHPRTRSRLRDFNLWPKHPGLRFVEPFGFFDFVHLEQHALCVLTDSGTVQEECCILGVPTVTMRQSTERPETVTCGSNLIAGLDTKRIVAGARIAVAQAHNWPLPEGYADPFVSTKIVNFILGGLCHV